MWLAQPEIGLPFSYNDWYSGEPNDTALDGYPFSYHSNCVRKVPGSGGSWKDAVSFLAIRDFFLRFLTYEKPCFESYFFVVEYEPYSQSWIGGLKPLTKTSTKTRIHFITLLDYSSRGRYEEGLIIEYSFLMSPCSSRHFKVMIACIP